MTAHRAAATLEWADTEERSQDMPTASESVGGRPVSRVEGVDKVTGRAHYTADVAVPGLVHAVLVQSEIPHGHVTEDSLRSGADRVGRRPECCMC